MRDSEPDTAPFEIDTLQQRILYFYYYKEVRAQELRNRSVKCQVQFVCFLLRFCQSYKEIA